MEQSTVHLAYFSPAGTTATAVNRIGTPLCPYATTYDLLENPLTQEVTIPATDILVVGAPVYAGRIPPTASQGIAMLRGEGTPAIVVATYGNRAYDDALLELYDMMTAQGFCVIAATAVVAQHSIFPSTAKGRPDQNDLDALDRFSVACLEKCKAFDGTCTPLDLPGNNPYRDQPKTVGVPFQPTGNVDCIGCLKCVDICPGDAIDPQDPRSTTKGKCLACAACIRICPTHARNFGGVAYSVAETAFGIKCKARLEPEFFL